MSSPPMHDGCGKAAAGAAMIGARPASERPRRRLSAARAGVCAAAWLPVLAIAAEPGTSLAAPLIKLVLGLIGVIATLLLCSRLLPRLQGFRYANHSKFKVLASLPVGQRERVVLMQAGQRQIVVGVAPGRVSALHVLDEPLELEAVQSPPSAFDAQPWLVRVLAGRRR